MCVFMIIFYRKWTWKCCYLIFVCVSGELLSRTWPKRLSQLEISKQNQQQTVNSVNGSENVYSVLITRALLSKAKSNIELFCSYCNLRMLNYDLFDSLMVLCNWLKHVWNCFAMETKINFIIFKERIRNRETFSFS